MNTIITGASQGLGFVISEKFLENKSNVALCSRNIYEMNKLKNPYYSKVFIKSCDVSNEIETKEFIEQSIEKYKSIDAIILNAGVYGPMGKIEDINLEEFKYAINVNFFGIVNAIKYIIPHFKENKKGKIVVISGGGATSPMPFLTSYAASKAACIRFIESVSIEVKSFGIDVNAIAPGALVTRLTDQILNAGPEIIGQEFYEKNKKWKDEGADSPHLAAELAWFLSTDISNGITGKLISAKWDNWKDFPNRINELQSSDLYCLRRVVS